MSVAERLAVLPATERNQLESQLMDFDQAWAPELLDRFVKRLQSHPSGQYRHLALVELVKIDLHRSWSAGSGRLLNDYLHQYPMLGTAQSVDAELIMAEFDARSCVDSRVALTSYESRFPRQFEQLKQLANQLRDASVSASSQPKRTEQELVQASIDTSRIDAARDTKRTSKNEAVVNLPVEFGRYRIIKELGSGAMGTVYLAHDSQLDRQVALKTPSFDSVDDDSVTRFYREARAAARIHHRNICPVFDVGEIDGRHFISMAFVKGRCMSEFIKSDSLPPQRTSAVLVHRLALALGEAHRHNVIHRDLKPANIMIDIKKEPVVMDFGLARQTDTESRVTQTGMAVGTPAYMSPEQIRGDLNQVGPRSDVYALGVILYELLTGKLPFRGAIAHVVYQIVNDEPIAPSQIRAGIDPELEAICGQMMAKSLDARFQSMDEVAADLKGYLKRGKTTTQNARPARSSNSVSPATPQVGESQVDLSPSGLKQVSETGALNAFFAGQSVDDPTHTAVEPRRSQQPTPLVQPRPGALRKRSGHRTQLIAAGLGGLVLLAGVTIYFADGSRVEIPEGVGAEIRAGSDGGIQSVTVLPKSDAVATRGRQAGAADSPRLGDLSAMGNAGPREVLTSSDWQWSEPVFLGHFFEDSHDLDKELGDAFTTWYRSSPRHILEKGLAQGFGGTDLWVFSREPTDSHWRPPVNLGDVINSSANESGPSLSPNGLEMVFSSDRPGGLGKGDDLWISSRESIGGQWSTPVNLGSQVNSPQWDGHQEFAEDGLAIYFSSGRKKGYGESDLYVTRRWAIGQPWSTAVNLGPQVNTSAGEMGPIVSSDGLVLMFFDADRPGGHGEFDLWMSRRDSISHAWSSPINVGPPINTAGHEIPRALSDDGRLLLFDRIPPGGQDAEGHGMWAVRRVPKRASGGKLAVDVEANETPNRSAIDKGGWTELFNGHDLSGWRQVHRHDVWNVSDGCIVSRNRRDKEGPAGWLETDRDFWNFELEFDYLMPRDGNSGVFLRTAVGKTIIGSDQLEIQLLDDLSPKYRGKVAENHTTGSIYGVVAPRPHAAAPSNQWNQMSIRAVGPRITVHINGVQIVDANLDALRQQIDGRFEYALAGPIGLQWHGHRVRFRGLRVRELDALGNTLPRSRAPG